MAGYEINQVEICPAQGKWLRKPLGFAGDGWPIYPETYAFEMKWEFATFQEWLNIQFLFDSLQSSGTTQVRLPVHPASLGGVGAFSYWEYSGCVFSEPVVGEYFAEFPSNMTLTILKIRVK